MVFGVKILFERVSVKPLVQMALTVSPHAYGTLVVSELLLLTGYGPVEVEELETYGLRMTS